MDGLFGFLGERDEALLERMGAALSHRGIGRAQTYATAFGSLGFHSHVAAGEWPRLGHGLLIEGDVALAVSGGVVLANGSRPELRQLHGLYTRQGIEALCAGIRGGFCLAVLDGPTLYLVRDGAGVRTLYHGTHGGRFLFAAEPKGVMAAPGFPRKLRGEALAQYLTFSFVPGAKTMLQGVTELLPGHHLTVGRESAKLQRYFFFEDDTVDPEQGAVSDEAWVERFRELHGQAVCERLPPSGPVGVFLSGGLDSSIVAAEATRQHSGPVLSYALHFGPEHPSELEHARAVAERCGTQHHEVLLSPKSFLPRMREAIWRLDDPIGDPITIPNYELARRVSKDVRWVLNGEGGDPCFGGPKNISMMLHHWYGGIERDEHFRERMYLASYRRAYEEVSRVLSPDLLKTIDPERCLEGVLTPFFSSSQPQLFLRKLLAINIRLKGAHLILPKVERMTSAWGVFAQAPLFDERLVRLAFELPAHLLLDKGVEKIVLKRAYADRLPASIIERPKSGMRVPVHSWFKGELQRYVRRELSRKRIRKAGLFNERRVKQLIDYDTVEGPGRYGLRLWMLLTFDLWHRIVVEGEAP